MRGKTNHGFLSVFLVLCGCYIICAAAPSNVNANELGINLYGKSHHILKSGQSRDNLKEFNPGIGLRATFGESHQSKLFFEGGTFIDTFDNRAKYLSVGFLLKVFGQFRVGVNAAAYRSESIRNGDTFFAPVPMAAISFGPVTLNGLYMPKYQGTNAYNTLGFYLTIRFFKGKPAEKH